MVLRSRHETQEPVRNSSSITRANSTVSSGLGQWLSLSLKVMVCSNLAIDFSCLSVVTVPTTYTSIEPARPVWCKFWEPSR